MKISMKKLLILLFVVSCTPTVDVRISENYVTMQSGFVKASLVDGFEHVYDSCELVVTNKATGVQYIYNAPQPVFDNISISHGNYGFYMSTPDPDSIQAYMAFTAYDTLVSIVSGANTVTLPAESRQALILVDKNTVDGAPTIQVGSKVAVMSISTNFYYAYVLDRAIVTYAVGGEQAVMPVSVNKETIYLFTAGIGSIGIDDPFVKVIVI